MLKRIGVLLLILYSIIIIVFEFLYGQTYVREYLTDIKGDVVFFAVNTTLTTLLLVLCAYNFILSITIHAPKKKINSLLPFMVFQSLLFLFLATDERFMIHERLGYYVGFDDAYLLLMIGLVELGVLYHYKELVWDKTLKSYSLYLGGVFFGIMILIDAFGPDTAFLRLSFEDLSKIWGVFFLFVYSFEFYRLQQGKSNQLKLKP